MSRARMISGWMTVVSRGGEPLAQPPVVVVVHQEADGAAMHAVDRLAGVHQPVQGPQHQAVAAERDHHVGLGRAARCRSGATSRASALRASGTGLATKAIRSYLGLVWRMAHGRWSPARQARTGDGTMERAVFVYTTWPSTVEAEKAGRSLVERRLAACVNILPGMVSLYRWEGKIERGEEAVMIVKTRASLARRGRSRGQGLHIPTLRPRSW